MEPHEVRGPGSVSLPPARRAPTSVSRWSRARGGLQWLTPCWTSPAPAPVAGHGVQSVVLSEESELYTEGLAPRAATAVFRAATLSAALPGRGSITRTSSTLSQVTRFADVADPGASRPRSRPSARPFRPAAAPVAARPAPRGAGRRRSVPVHGPSPYAAPTRYTYLSSTTIFANRCLVRCTSSRIYAPFCPACRRLTSTSGTKPRIMVVRRRRWRGRRGPRLRQWLIWARSRWVCCGSVYWILTTRSRVGCSHVARRVTTSATVVRTHHGCSWVVASRSPSWPGRFSASSSVQHAAGWWSYIPRSANGSRDGDHRVRRGRGRRVGEEAGHVSSPRSAAVVRL